MRKNRNNCKPSEIRTFWEGVNSSFDLFGANTNVVLREIKKRSAERLRKNTLSSDFAIVGRELRRAINELKLKQEIKQSGEESED